MTCCPLCRSSDVETTEVDAGLLVHACRYCGTAWQEYRREGAA